MFQNILHYYISLSRHRRIANCKTLLHNTVRTMSLSRHSYVCNEDFSNLDFGNIPLNSVYFSFNGRFPSRFIGSHLNEWNFLSGHDGEVHTLCVSNDEKYMITGGFDKEAIIWSLESGHMLGKLSGHTGAVKKICNLNDTRCLVYCDQSISNDDQADVFLWDIQSSSLLNNFLGLVKLRYNDIGRITDMSVSNDKKMCAIVTKNGYLFIWKLNSGMIKYMMFNGVSINCVVFDKSGSDKCIIGTNSGSIFEINTSNMKHKLLRDVSSKTLYNNSAVMQYCRTGLAPYYIRCLDYSEKAGLLFVGMQGGVSKLIDLKSNKSKRFECHSPVESVFISPLGKYAISLFYGRFIMHDLDKHIDITDLRRPDYIINSYVLSADETFCLLGDGHGNVYYLDILAKKITKSVRVHKGNVYKISLINKECLFISVSFDGSVAIYDVNTFEKILHMPPREKYISSISISQNNRYCIMCAERNTAVIYDNKNGTRKKLKDSYGLIREGAFTSDSKYAITTATPSASASIPHSCLHKISDITDAIELPGCAYKISTSLSTDGHNLLAYLQSGKVIIYDVETNAVKQSIELSDNHVSAKFSLSGQSGKGVYTCLNKAEIIDISDGSVQIISDHNGYVSGALSDDGCYCITGSSENMFFGARDNSAIIHDLVHHKKILLASKDERIDNVTYIPDCHLFTTISKKAIVFWNFQGQPVLEYTIKGCHSMIVLSSNGKYLLLQRSSIGLPNYVECIDIEKDEVIYSYYPIDNCNVQNCNFSNIIGDDRVKELLKRNGAMI